MERLERDSEEDDRDALVIDTSRLLRRGKWQNPDVTRVIIEVYDNLQTFRPIVTTYEVKRWGAWDVSAVFEAASHDRFAHEAYVVLEWVRGIELDDPHQRPLLVQIERECRRFGVGLARMVPYYQGFRLHIDFEPIQRDPHDRDVDAFLDHVFERKHESRERYREMLRAVRSGWDAMFRETSDAMSDP